VKAYSEEIARQKAIRMRQADEAQTAKLNAAKELQRVKDQLAKANAEKAALTGRTAVKKKKRPTPVAAPAESVVAPPPHAGAAEIARELYKLSNPSGTSSAQPATPLPQGAGLLN